MTLRGGAAVPVLFLGLLAAVSAAGVLGHFGGAGLELGRTKLIRLDSAARGVLGRLEDDVFVTYYVSARSKMPSHMRGVEKAVTGLLESMRGAGRGRVDFRIVDPEAEPELADWAAAWHVRPFRARHLSRDSYSERTVWSGLTVHYGPRRPAVLNGIGPHDLPHLQSNLLQVLEQRENPRPPVFAVAAPEGFSELRAWLRERGEVMEVDLARSTAFPENADVLFWIEPKSAGESHLRELRRFLDRGKNVVLMGGERRSQLSEDGQQATRLRFEKRSDGLSALATGFGVRVLPELVLDEQAGQLWVEDQGIKAPFVILCNPYNQDFQTLSGEPNGHLLFSLPSAFSLDQDRLSRLGLQGEVLATTSDRTAVLSFPEGWTPLGELTRERGEPSPKLPLVVLLRPSSSWKGQLLVAASSSPFADGVLSRPEYAHRRLLQVLVDTLASPERLILSRSEKRGPELLPELGPSARLLWRGATVLFPPAFLVALALSRGFSWARGPGNRRSGFPRQPAFALLIAGLLIFLRLFRSTGAADARFDLTAEELSRVAPETRRIARQATGGNAVRAELVFSSRERMPAEMRPHIRRLYSLVEELGQAGAELSSKSTRPEEMGAEDRARLRALGVEPVFLTSQEESGTTVNTVYSALVLSTNASKGSKGRPEVLSFPNVTSFENLEFRLAFALWRLQTGRRPHVAFASDLPRLTPAEVHENYQTRGLLAPSGTDVFSIARELVRLSDFEVSHVDPRNPVLPNDLDALLWLQPRRRIDRMLETATSYLHRGGALLVAAQHFNVQSRQYPGTDYKIVYWPQPQTPEVDHLYFPDLGIHLVREVFFDDLKTRMVMKSEIHGGDRRKFEAMPSALPFLIRASSANFSKDSPITRELGDQAFIWGNYLELEPEKLRQAGIAATPLIMSSEKTWSYDWRGGWIPEELLTGPPEDEDRLPRWLGRKPLAVLFEGRFPGVDPSVLEESSGEPTGKRGESAPGRLLFIGGSEMFKNHRILEQEFRSDHLLLNAVAALALPEDLARILARRRVAPGFDYVRPEERLAFRAFVIGAFPAALLLFGLLRGVAGRASTAGKSPSRQVFFLEGRLLLLALVAAALTWWDFQMTRSESTHRRHDDRIGPLVPEESRKDMRVAVVGVQQGEGHHYYFARVGGVWRCVNDRNALGSRAAIEGVVGRLLSARGLRQTGERDRRASYGMDISSTWKLSLYGPEFSRDPKRDLLFRLDVGAGIPGTEGSYVRLEGRDEIWAVDQNLRAELDAPRREGHPPLLDPSLLPATWPGASSRWDRLSVQPLSGPGFDLEVASASGSASAEPEGRSADEWLLNKGGTSLAIELPAVIAYTLFLRGLPYMGVLDPREHFRLGFEEPRAALKLFPENGEPLEMVLGRDLDGGGAAVLNRLHGSAYRVGSELIPLIFPPAKIFEEPPAQNPWSRWLGSPQELPQDLLELLPKSESEALR